MKYIYQHLGLGDHIICNGLIRTIIKEDESYTMFVKEHYLESVSFMYRDLKNLSFMVGDDVYVKNVLQTQKEKIIIGFEGVTTNWDEFFYNQHNVKFQYRWDKFYLERDRDREKHLFNLLNPKNEKFVLIHNKGRDNIDRINYDVINKNYKIIYVENITGNIFDYLELIEKSEEIHCVESSFHVLVDSFNEINQNIFFHTKLKSRGFTHKIRNSWYLV